MVDNVTVQQQWLLLTNDRQSATKQLTAVLSCIGNSSQPLSKQKVLPHLADGWPLTSTTSGRNMVYSCTIKTLANGMCSYIYIYIYIYGGCLCVCVYLYVLIKINKVSLKKCINKYLMFVRNCPHVNERSVAEISMWKLALQCNVWLAESSCGPAFSTDIYHFYRRIFDIKTQC